MVARVHPSPIRSLSRRWTPHRIRHAATALPTGTSDTVRSRGPPMSAMTWHSRSSLSSPLWPSDVMQPQLIRRPTGWTTVLLSGYFGLCPQAWEPCVKNNRRIRSLRRGKYSAGLFETR